MSAALAGLIGVLVGSLLNIAGGLLLARRREARELRTAARLVVRELEEIQGALRWARRDGRWGWLFDLPNERWLTHEQLLASSLGRDDWRSVSDLYESIRPLPG